MPSFEQDINIFKFSLTAIDVISLLWYDNTFERIQINFFSGLITYTKIFPNLFVQIAYVSVSSIIIFVIGDNSLVVYIYVNLLISFPFAINL